MKILGVDPGTVCTGYGVIEYKNNSFKLIKSGTIVPVKNSEIPIRLKEIYRNLILIIQKCSPDEFSIETAFYGRNAQSALKIGQARGISLLAAVNNEIPVKEYSPREVKKAVVGNGAASKEQVQFMVKTLLNCKDKDMKLDESDALAIAICHGLKQNSNISKSGNWKSFLKNNPERIVE